MTRIEKKEQQLARVEQRLFTIRHDSKVIRQQIANIRKKITYQEKLIRAGKLFEIAGILDSYDPTTVLKLLRFYAANKQGEYNNVNK